MAYERQRNKTKDKLLNAFIDTLEEQDLASMQINELTKRAGLSRSTFYYNYRSITEMVHDLVHYLCGEIFNEIVNQGPYESYYVFWLKIMKITLKYLPALNALAKEHLLSNFCDAFIDYLHQLKPLDEGDDYPIYAKGLTYSYLKILMDWANNLSDDEEETKVVANELATLSESIGTLTKIFQRYFLQPQTEENSTKDEVQSPVMSMLNYLIQSASNDKKK